MGGHPCHRQPACSSRRGLAHGQRQGRTPPLGNNYAVCTGSFCRPDNGTQIVRILNPVTQHQQRRFALFGSTLQQFFQRNVCATGTLRRNALMHCPAGQLGQLGLCHNLYGNALLLGKADDLLQAAAFLPHIEHVDPGTVMEQAITSFCGDPVIFRFRHFRRLLPWTVVFSGSYIPPYLLRHGISHARCRTLSVFLRCYPL